MKKRIAAVLCAAAMTFSMFAVSFAAESEAQSGAAAESEAQSGAAAEEKAAGEAAGEEDTSEALDAAGAAEAQAAETESASEASLAIAGQKQAKSLDELKWSDYAISVDGEVWDFPMTYTEFEKFGFEPEDDVTASLEPYQYGMFTYKKGDDTIYIYICNFDVNSLPANECIVAGVSFDDFEIPENGAVVELPGGVKRGESTVDDIKAAYGEPTNTYDGDLFTKLTYSTDAYETLDLSVYKDSGTLKNVEVKCMTKPEDFETGQVSQDVPAAVSSYKKPEALSDDPNTYQIRLKDNIYSLPVPVSTLIADGFELDKDDSAESVMGGSTDWVTLHLGGQTLKALARNFEKDAVTIENCWVTSISAGKQDLDVEAEIPGGITVGMSKDDFAKKVDELGIDAQMEESGDFEYYTYAAPEFGQQIQVVVFTGDSGVYPQNTVLTLDVENDVLQ